MPPTATPARLCALAKAHVNVGVHETPAGSNHGPLIDAWNMEANGVLGEPWCMSFQHAMFKSCGVELGGWAGVENFVQWATRHGYLVTRPFRGDLVCFDWNDDRWYDHVGIVDKVLAVGPGGRPPYVIRTVEGNCDNAVRVKCRAGVSWKFVRVPGVVPPLP